MTSSSSTLRSGASCATQWLWKWGLMATLVDCAYEPKLYRLAPQDEAQRKVRSSNCVTRMNIYVSMRCRTRMSPVAVAWQVSGGSEREWVDIDRSRRYETRNVMSSRDCEKQMGDIKTIWLWHGWTAWCQTRLVIIDDWKSSRRGRRTEHRHTRFVRQDACFRDTSRVCCSSAGGGSLQRRVQYIRNCFMVCDACEENTKRRSSQSNLWRDCKMQRTTGWTSWPTRLWCNLWRRLLRSDIWWHKPSGNSGCKEFHSVRTQITMWGMRRKSSWPQLCSQKSRANGCLEQMAAKMYVNLRPPGLLPAYGGHAALLEGVGPRP